MQPLLHQDNGAFFTQCQLFFFAVAHLLKLKTPKQILPFSLQNIVFKHNFY